MKELDVDHRAELEEAFLRGRAEGYSDRVAEWCSGQMDAFGVEFLPLLREVRGCQVRHGGDMCPEPATYRAVVVFHETFVGTLEVCQGHKAVSGAAG